jgi:hypothetical protein
MQNKCRLVLRRRLRILTLRLGVATAPAEVFAHADADAVLVLLAHKLGRAARAQNLPEARALLQDWLVLATAAYNRRAALPQGAAIASAEQAR